MTDLVSAVFVVSLDFWLGFLILDAFDGSLVLDIVNASLSLHPGNEELIHGGTGTCTIQTIRTTCEI